MIVITQGATSRVVLHDSTNFKVTPKRAMAARAAVAGNVIKQVSTLHASSAEAVFSGLISKADGDAIEAMKTASPNVVLYAANKAYDAIIEAELLPAGGKQYDATITFSIVRQIP